MPGHLSLWRIPPENHIGWRDVGLLLHVGRDKSGFGFNSKGSARASRAVRRAPASNVFPQCSRRGANWKSFRKVKGFSSAFAVDIIRPVWLQFVRRQQSVQPKQIMDYEEKTRVITKLMQSNPEETTRLERHYEEIVATYAHREKTAQGQMEHLIAEIAKLKGQGD